ncbi:hypothetical protein RJT34_23325 [Clitoria ternatea]|uniref:Uncharacterized protein n=1 Tax=Clitoria ternatea TaxID=43366 RepID=A0AAN9FMC4_CLITE
MDITVLRRVGFITDAIGTHSSELKVFGELLFDSQHLLMVTIAAALLEIGYEIQVFSLSEGPGHNVWKNIRVPTTVIRTCDKPDNTVDWLNSVTIPAMCCPSGFSTTNDPMLFSAI